MKGIKRASRFNLLAREQLESIHEASVSILERTGIRYDSEDARERLVRAGASIHPNHKDVVTFPRAAIEEAIRKVPKECTYCARDPKKDLTYDREHLFPYAGGGDPKMVDLETGQVRPSYYEDVEMAARLGDFLDNNHFAASLVMANDVPDELVVLKTMEAAMRNSTKPVTAYAPNKETVDIMMQIWACVSGGEEELRKRPLVSLSTSPSSPLTYGAHNCDVMIRSAELGFPFTVVPCPIAGETGPMSISGSLAQQNAETLGGIMLLQTVTTKLPMVYAGRVCFMHPQSGRDLWAVPEQALASAAMVQIAHKYGMISDTNGMSSEIPRWEVQMGLERMMTALIPALAGADSMSGIGSGWEGASCLEMMVIDNEIFQDVGRITEGIGTSPESLALGLVDEVGHMGSFLAKRHTVEQIRKGEVRSSPLWDKRISERAAKEGVRTTQEAARDRARAILREHEPEPLDRDIQSEIDHIMKSAQRTLSSLN